MGEEPLYGYERELVNLWREFSHDEYAASFMVLAPDVIHRFAEWVESRGQAEPLSTPPDDSN